MTRIRVLVSVLSSVAAGSLLGLLASAVAAAGPGRADPPIVVTPRNPTGTIGPPSVGVGVRDAGRAGMASAASGVPPAGSAGLGGSACRWVRAPEVEWVLRRLPAQLSGGVGPGRVGRTGSTGSGGQDQVDPMARLYQQVCAGIAGQYRWFGPAPAGRVPAAPTPAELAREAYAQLLLPAPTAGHSPNLRLADGRPAVLVGEHTWLWTDRARFRPRSTRLQVGPVWAAVTATPVALTVDPGDGAAAVSCPGPGTQFVPGRYSPHAPSPTCDYQYRQSSAGRPGGVLTAEYRISWRVRWTGATRTAPAAGRLPDMTSRATVTLAVAEAQALDSAQVPP